MTWSNLPAPKTMADIMEDIKNVVDIIHRTPPPRPQPIIMPTMAYLLFLVEVEPGLTYAQRSAAYGRVRMLRKLHRKLPDPEDLLSWVHGAAT